MADTAVLTREQAELLATLVEAQRRAGRDYTAGFRASIHRGEEHLTLVHSGLPVDGLDVAGRDISALAQAGLVTVHKSVFTAVIRVDLI